MRRNITIAVLGTVLLAVGAPTPAGAQAGGAASASTVKAFTKRLAQVGIPTYRPGSRKPVVRVRGRVSPVQLTTDLARSAALGAQLRSGMTAGQLDATTGPLRLGTTSIPGGALVVAWAKGTDTRSARLARTLLGPVDWSHYEQIVLPHAVMLLFSSDVALHLPQRPAKRRAAKRTVAATAAAAPVPGGPCTATRDFIENTVNKVFNAIGHVRTDHATINRIFGGFFGKIIGTAGDVLSFGVNTAIDGARKIVLGATRIPVKLVTDAIAGVAATVSVVSQVANGIMPWKGAHTIDATPKRKGGVPGTLTLTVTAPIGEIPYPDWVKNCASVFEFPLPSFTPKNEPVSWRVAQAPEGLVTLGPASGPLDDAGKATQPFTTGDEPADWATGPEHEGRVDVISTVHRTDLDPLVRKVSDGVMRLLPGLVRDSFGTQIRQVINPMISSIKKNIDDVRDVVTRSYFPVIFHDPPEPKPAPPAPAAGIAGHWTGTFTEADGSATWAADFTESGGTVSGTVQVIGSNCNHGGPASGTISGDQFTLTIQSEDAITATGTLSGDTMSGTFSHPGHGDPCVAVNGTFTGTRGG
jgi:hypothetical protein